MATSTHERRDSTADATRRWRTEQLQAAGFPLREARAMSERADIDLHLAVRLLRDGCPVATALRILL